MPGLFFTTREGKTKNREDKKRQKIITTKEIKLYIVLLDAIVGFHMYAIITVLSLFSLSLKQPCLG